MKIMKCKHTKKRVFSQEIKKFFLLSVASQTCPKCLNNEQEELFFIENLVITKLLRVRDYESLS